MDFKKVKDISFVEVYSLYRDEVPIYKIAKKVGIPGPIVTKITKGIWVIPPEQREAVKKAGFKICEACHYRPVPIKPQNNVSLRKLCWVCFKLGAERVYSLPPTLKEII